MPGAWPEIWGDEELETLLTSAVQAIAQNSRAGFQRTDASQTGHSPAPRVEVLSLQEMGGARPVFGSDAHMVAKVGANLHLALEAIREAGFDRFAPDWSHKEERSFLQAAADWTWVSARITSQPASHVGAASPVLG